MFEKCTEMPITGVLAEMRSCLRGTTGKAGSGYRVMATTGRKTDAFMSAHCNVALLYSIAVYQIDTA